MPRTSNKGGATTSALPVGAPPLFSVDSTPERHVVRESTSFVRRVNEWIAGESRRDAGLLRTLQIEHSRAGDAAWKAMIESEILAADDDVQVAAAAFRRLDAIEGRRVDCARDDDAADAVDEWRRDFDRVMDRAAAGASSEHAKVSEQLAAQAAALREQRAATAAAAAAEAAKSDGEADDIGELTTTSDGDGGDGRRRSLTEPPVVVQEEKKEVVVGAQDKHRDHDDDNDTGPAGDDDKDEFFDVDEEIWEKEPSPLRMRR